MIRKLIAIILVLALLLPSASLAKSSMEKKWHLRFNQYDTEELVEANKALQATLFERGAAADGVLVPAGMYVVGEDIPAGTYRIEYRPLTDVSFCTFTAVNEETWLSFITTLGFDSSNEIGKIELPEGTNITLSGGDVYFYTYTGLFH